MVRTQVSKNSRWWTAAALQWFSRSPRNLAEKQFGRLERSDR